MNTVLLPTLLMDVAVVNGEILAETLLKIFAENINYHGAENKLEERD